MEVDLFRRTSHLAGRAKPLLGLLVLLASTTVSLEAQYTEYVPRTVDERALVKVEDEWCDAAIKRDRARLDSVFAEDLIYLTDSASMTKAQAIDDYLTDTVIHTVRLTGVVIRIYGSMAIVTSHVHVTYTWRGEAGSGTHASTDVFVKRDGRWRLVST